MTDEIKTEPIFTNATLMSSEFKKKGIIGKGKSKGQEWHLFSAEFTPFGANKKFKFSAFKKKEGANGLCISELIPGNDYNIGYNQEDADFTNDQNEVVNYTRRSIFFIDVPKDGPQETPTAKAPATEDKKMTPHIDVTEFIKNYREGVKPEDDSLNYMIGSYIKTYFKDSVQLLIDEYESIHEDKVE